jgi:methionine synthase I (cobalamin-dependent)
MRNRRAEFRQALAAGPLVADGAMGTMLLARGASLHQCLDELNLSQPELVREVHLEYLRAGAQIIGTNTFGANRNAKLEEINRAGVQIALEVAATPFRNHRAFVAGIVGPSGGSARAQIEVLVEGGVDLLALETFQDLGELLNAIQASRQAAGPGMAIAAHLSIENDGTLNSGASIREFTELLDESTADVIGLNCSWGPEGILMAVQKMRTWTSKPLSVMPNAGLPAWVDGRALYPVSPESMAEYAGRFLRAGVRIIGGCCGTTPEHIARIQEIVHAGNGPMAAPSATLT